MGQLRTAVAVVAAVAAARVAAATSFCGSERYPSKAAFNASAFMGEWHTIVRDEKFEGCGSMEVLNVRDGVMKMWIPSEGAVKSATYKGNSITVSDEEPTISLTFITADEGYQTWAGFYRCVTAADGTVIAEGKDVYGRTANIGAYALAHASQELKMYVGNKDYISYDYAADSVSSTEESLDGENEANGDGHNDVYDEDYLDYQDTVYSEYENSNTNLLCPDQQLNQSQRVPCLRLTPLAPFNRAAFNERVWYVPYRFPNANVCHKYWMSSNAQDNTWNIKRFNLTENPANPTAVPEVNADFNIAGSSANGYFKWTPLRLAFLASDCGLKSWALFYSCQEEEYGTGYTTPDLGPQFLVFSRKTELSPSATASARRALKRVLLKVSPDVLTTAEVDYYVNNMGATSACKQG